MQDNDYCKVYRSNLISQDSRLKAYFLESSNLKEKRIKFYKIPWKG